MRITDELLLGIPEVREALEAAETHGLHKTAQDALGVSEVTYEEIMHALSVKLAAAQLREDRMLSMFESFDVLAGEKTAANPLASLATKFRRTPKLPTAPSAAARPMSGTSVIPMPGSGGHQAMPVPTAVAGNAPVRLDVPYDLTNPNPLPLPVPRTRAEQITPDSVATLRRKQKPAMAMDPVVPRPADYKPGVGAQDVLAMTAPARPQIAPPPGYDPDLSPSMLIGRRSKMGNYITHPDHIPSAAIDTTMGALLGGIGVKLKDPEADSAQLMRGAALGGTLGAVSGIGATQFAKSRLNQHIDIENALKDAPPEAIEAALSRRRDAITAHNAVRAVTVPTTALLGAGTTPSAAERLEAQAQAQRAYPAYPMLPAPKFAHYITGPLAGAGMGALTGTIAGGEDARFEGAALGALAGGALGAGAGIGGHFVERGMINRADKDIAALAAKNLAEEELAKGTVGIKQRLTKNREFIDNLVTGAAPGAGLLSGVGAGLGGKALMAPEDLAGDAKVAGIQHARQGGLWGGGVAGSELRRNNEARAQSLPKVAAFPLNHALAGAGVGGLIGAGTGAAAAGPENRNTGALLGALGGAAIGGTGMGLGGHFANKIKLEEAKKLPGYAHFEAAQKATKDPGKLREYSEIIDELGHVGLEASEDATKKYDNWLMAGAAGMTALPAVAGLGGGALASRANTEQPTP